MSIRIKDKTVRIYDSFNLYRDKRFFGCIGAGTLSTNLMAKVPSIGTQLGFTKHVSFTLAVDNNALAIREAIANAQRHQPSLWWRMRHPFKHDHFAAINSQLSSLDDAEIGFGRSAEAALASAPRYYPDIKEAVSVARSHDLVNGASTSIIAQPIPTGSHSGAPQMLLHAEATAQSLLRGLRIGILCVPSDPDSIPMFKKMFPMQLEEGLFGTKVRLVYDDGLAHRSRPRQLQDTYAVQAVLMTAAAFTYDLSQLGPNDIWQSLYENSNDFVIVSVAEEDLLVWRRVDRFGKREADEEVTIKTITRTMKQALYNRLNRLAVAEVNTHGPVYVMVAVKVKKRLFEIAREDALLPKNVKALFVPTNSEKVTAIALMPVNGKIPSLERLWEMEHVAKPKPYRLPQKIVNESYEVTWDSIVEKTAEFSGYDTKTLLGGE